MKNVFFFFFFFFSPEERPGECPVNEGLVGACIEGCSSDSDCTDDVTQKCCSNGCGHVCTDAVNIGEQIFKIFQWRIQSSVVKLS